MKKPNDGLQPDQIAWLNWRVEQIKTGCSRGGFKIDDDIASDMAMINLVAMCLQHCADQLAQIATAENWEGADHYKNMADMIRRKFIFGGRSDE